MDFITILFIGIGLAMDASAVSLAKGMSLDKDQVKKCAFILALAFGFFQALMPAIGYYAGSHFAEYIQSIDHWIAFILLSLIGINMIREGKEEKEIPVPGEGECRAGAGSGGIASGAAGKTAPAGAYPSYCGADSHNGQ